MPVDAAAEWRHAVVGDPKHNNRSTPADAAIALEIAVSGSTSCDPTTLAAADVSGDGSVTSLDALMTPKAAADDHDKMRSYLSQISHIH